MSTLITFKYKSETHTLPLARACKLINMAESTFSSRWRAGKEEGKTDQECFDTLTQYRKQVQNKRVGAPRIQSSEAATIRSQDRSYMENKGVIDGFLFGLT